MLIIIIQYYFYAGSINNGNQLSVTRITLTAHQPLVIARYGEIVCEITVDSLCAEINSYSVIWYHNDRRISDSINYNTSLVTSNDTITSRLGIHTVNGGGVYNCTLTVDDTTVESNVTTFCAEGKSNNNNK